MSSLLLLLLTISVTVFTAGLIVPLLVGRATTEEERARRDQLLRDELAVASLTARTR